MFLFQVNVCPLHNADVFLHLICQSTLPNVFIPDVKPEPAHKARHADGESSEKESSQTGCLVILYPPPHLTRPAQEEDLCGKTMTKLYLNSGGDFVFFIWLSQLFLTIE